MNIFTITAIDHGIKECSQRCFGWFDTLQIAMEAVGENRGDMNEQFYNYLVIEEFYPGIHPTVESETWYRWENSRWTITPKPQFAFGTTNWALG